MCLHLLARGFLLRVLDGTADGDERERRQKGGATTVSWRVVGRLVRPSLVRHSLVRGGLIGDGLGLGVCLCHGLLGGSLVGHGLLDRSFLDIRLEISGCGRLYLGSRLCLSSRFCLHGLGRSYGSSFGFRLVCSDRRLPGFRLGSRRSDLGGSLAQLAHAGLLTDLLAQVVELGAIHVADRANLDLLDLGRVDGERPLDTDAERLLADGERLACTRALPLEHDPLEDLDASPRALDHLESARGLCHPL